MYHHGPCPRTTSHHPSIGFHVRSVEGSAIPVHTSACTPCRIDTKNIFLERVGVMISEHGPEYAYEHICDLAMGTHDMENHQLDTGRLRINCIHIPPECKDPLDVRILIGRTEVAHHVLIGCDFGCAALGEAFGLTTSAIRRIAGRQMGYLGQRDNGIVAFSGGRRWIYWPGFGDADCYTIGQLMETAAGLAILGEQQTKELQKKLPTCFSEVDIDVSCHSMYLTDEQTAYSTISRLACAIHDFGVDAAWDNIDKIAGSQTSQPQCHEGALNIQDFYRPKDYSTIDDIIMVVAGTELELGALRICDIGCVLIQQLFSKKYAGTRRDEILSMKKIRRPTTPGNATEDLPYKVYLDSEHVYISWAPFAWWGKYSLGSLDPLMKRTLSKLPPAVLRPKPHSSWMKKNNPNVRHGMCPWEYARLPSMKSTVTLTEQSRHGVPSPSLDVANRSAITLVKLPTDEISGSPPQLVQPSCKDVLVAKRDSLELPRLHTTEPLPRLDEALPERQKHLWGRLRHSMAGLPRLLCLW